MTKETDNNSNSNNSSTANDDLVKQIKASAKEIWLAGLGAFSQKQEDTSSQSLYQQLVKEGRDIERVSREQLDRNIQNVKSFAVGGVDQVRERAAGSLHRLESVFDERVSKALNRLGLATAQVQGSLEEKLNTIEQRLADLEGVVESLAQERSNGKTSQSATKAENKSGKKS